jgi:hypothetical protein
MYMQNPKKHVKVVEMRLFQHPLFINLSQ